MLKVHTAAALKAVVKLYVLAKKPLFIHGGTGRGKSAVIREAISEIKITEPDGTPYTFACKDVRASQTSEVDWRGLPSVQGDRARWLPPEDLLPYVDKDGKYGVLLLDEINAAPREVQAALYQLIWERCLGAYQFPETWAIVAAGNVASDKGVVNKFAGPLANRFGHVEYVDNASDWIKWAATQPTIHSDLVEFLTANPNFVYGEVSEVAFPTPRSLTVAGELMQICDAVGMTQGEVLQAQCGPAVAQAFVDWAALRTDLPKWSEVLAGTAKVPAGQMARDQLGLNLLKDLTAGSVLAVCQWIQNKVVPVDEELAMTLLAKIKEKAKGPGFTTGSFRTAESFETIFKANSKAKADKALLST